MRVIFSVEVAYCILNSSKLLALRMFLIFSSTRIDSKKLDSKNWKLKFKTKVVFFLLAVTDWMTIIFLTHVLLWFFRVCACPSQIFKTLKKG